MTPRDIQPVSPATPLRSVAIHIARHVVAIAGIAAACVSCSRASDSGARDQGEAVVSFPRRASTEGELVRSLRGVATPARRWRIRLSIDDSLPKCAAATVEPYADLTCGPLAPSDTSQTSVPGSMQTTTRPELLERAATVSLEVNRAPTADALHAAALVELLGGDTLRISLDRSVSLLVMASRIDRNSPALFSDLAAAYLVRASVRHDAGDLLAALDASTRAFRLDTLHPAAVTNRTLALQQLALNDEAAASAARLLSIDSTSVWSSDVRVWQVRQRAEERRRLLTDSADPAVLRTYANNAPVTALALAWNVMLGRWGDALLKGDRSRAVQSLGGARVIGEELAARGEQSTIDAVATIERARGTTAERRLARGHLLFAELQRYRSTNDFKAADSVASELLAVASASAPLAHWSAYAKGSNLMSLRRNQDAERALADMLRKLDASAAGRYPAIAGRGRWAAALLRLREGQSTQGLREMRTARVTFEQLGFAEFAAWTTGIEGEVAVQSGNDESGLNTLIAGLRLFREAPRSNGRHNTLFVLASAASRMGWPYAALTVQDEDAALSSRGASPITRAEERLSRARLLVAINDLQHALEVLAEADRAIAAIPDTGMRVQLHHELGTIRGRALLASDPARAFAVFDSSVRILTPTRNAEKILPAQLGRAYAAVALNRDSVADADLRAVAELYLAKTRDLRPVADAQRERLAVLAQRDALARMARPVFDSLITRRLRNGGPDAAATSLALFERWRAGSSPWARASQETSRTMTRGTDGTLANPAPVIVYAAVADQLVTWTAVGGSVSVRVASAPRDSLEGLIERTRLALERGDAAATSVQLAPLYDLLVRPVESAFGAPGSTVSFVLDQPLANLPIAALYDRQSQRYLIQQHAVRVSTDVRAAQQTTTARKARQSDRARLVAVESPVFDPARYPSLLPIPNTASEVRAVRTQYVASEQLSGRSADSATVSQALSRATVFHFAGHAVLDESRPDRSSLAMLPAGLSATAIAQLPLGKLELAVLSACETSRSATTRGAGLGELTSAFLLAGAGGVIGSLWSTEDEATSRLMARFHQAYTRSGDAASALRVAQMAMVERPPGEWAAFRYVGR